KPGPSSPPDVPRRKKRRPGLLFFSVTTTNATHMDNLDAIVAAAVAEFAAVDDPNQLEQVKARYLGKSGSLTERLKALGKLPPEERRVAGAEINRAKQAVEGALEARREALRSARLQAQLAAEALDVTLPGRGAGLGG